MADTKVGGISFDNGLENVADQNQGIPGDANTNIDFNIGDLNDQGIFALSGAQNEDFSPKENCIENDQNIENLGRIKSDSFDGFGLGGDDEDADLKAAMEQSLKEQ